MRSVLRHGIVLAVCLILSSRDAPADESAPSGTAGVQLATFVADITPHQGEILDCGLSSESGARLIEHPLLAKGIVLKDRGGVYVLCAFDWEAINNDSNDFARQELAAAAGSIPARVAAQ